MQVSAQAEGKVFQINDVVDRTKAGEKEFKTREFILEVECTNGFKDYLKLQLSQDKVVLIDAFKIGDAILVDINVKGTKTVKDGVTTAFNNLIAWRIARSSEKVTTQEG